MRRENEPRNVLESGMAHRSHLLPLRPNMNNPLASSPRAILVPRLYLLLALVPCGAGCAAPAAEAGRDPAAREAPREKAQADSPRILDFEELFESKWRQATREPIASPSSTPFDDDPSLRELYRDQPTLL